MILQSLNTSKFLSANKEGVCLGEWVSECKYMFNVVSNINDSTKAAVQIWARMNIDYMKGGSIEYICELIYTLGNLKGKPPIDILVHIGLNCPKELERLFDKENLIDRNEQTKEMWIAYDKDVIEKMMVESLNKNFPN